MTGAKKIYENKQSLLDNEKDSIELRLAGRCLERNIPTSASLAACMWRFAL